jgi:hypothetical protein
MGFGPGGGAGFGSGRNPPQHVAKGISLRPSKTEVAGSIPPEVIQRIVRQNFGRFKNCYETGLRTNPSLNGRVAVKFAIGRDGSVTMVQDGGSDLPDQGVVQCVVRSFGTLSFPQPERGIVTVIYPMVFSPSE